MTDISVMNKSNEGNGLSGVILTPNSACTPTSLPEAASQPFGYQNIRNDDVIDLVSLDDDDLEQIDTFYLQTLNSTVTQSLDTKQCAPTNSDSQQSLPNTSPISHPVLQDEKENSEENDDSDDIIEIIEDAVNQVQVLAKEHDLTISIMKEPDLPQIFVNIESISRAFMNILMSI